MRLMEMAEKFNMPIVTLVDTPGAYPGIGAEERHVAEAIAVNIRDMSTIKVPIIYNCDWRRRLWWCTWHCSR